MKSPHYAALELYRDGISKGGSITWLSLSLIIRRDVNIMSSDDNRGLASADEKIKERVAREGGKASHGGGGGGEGKGFDGMDEEKQREIAKKGGESSHSGGRND